MNSNRTEAKTEIRTTARPPQLLFRDRPSLVPANHGRAAEPFTQAELAVWVQKAKDLPDIRWDKVQAMREAIREGTFDHDPRLADLSKLLPDELREYFLQTGNK
ncbi:MAG TPA: flagellar biosynthesis anti-sigma factor FlgM [Phycisphaerae bacterium]|nr:flagellar biosynthesis anti-sigma factor FlgM [Phycisphaerae bacterium]HOJ75666.1 flagellar biosynthesis anti-sigma factor FlgM [Phycisphaerae bacterium]HOM52534.1 flagellar biosynthesis anti-sigma factor FlgM [Phycisphaerae bacterium]HON66410.1 flagellar biosynthesis anti-sigma factor FlgM [Phycisphaerae bacterium]HOQ86833.1 flagellar biosynthesis anti-sigma factor FlgM [Phycisphaerae bacterium]